MPYAIMPPMTPTMITGIGVVSPRAISSGRSTLSIRPTGTM
jgi:hypothetical protein